MEKKLFKTIEIKIPSIPNFIRVGKNNEVYPIKDFTETELREIGEEWTRQLIEKGKSKNFNN
jgi:hypothetical protein